MTIGPEPIRRMDERSVRLGIEEVLQRLIEGNLRRPAGGRMELPRIPPQVKNIPPAARRACPATPPRAWTMPRPGSRLPTLTAGAPPRRASRTRLAIAGIANR